MQCTKCPACDQVKKFEINVLRFARTVLMVPLAAYCDCLDGPAYGLPVEPLGVTLGPLL
jgi:hypothetical protein